MKTKFLKLKLKNSYTIMNLVRVSCILVLLGNIYKGFLVFYSYESSKRNEEILSFL